MKKLVEYAVDHPVTVLMVTLGVVLLGVISYGRLGMDLFPDLNNPRLYVEVQAGELPPAEMEKRYVKTLESLAIRQRGVVQVYSECRTGRASLTVEYRWGRDMDEAYLDLQKALAQGLRGDGSVELNITRHDPNSAPVLVLALTHDNIHDMYLLAQVARTYLRNELIRLDGVAGVAITGDEEREVVVATDEYRLKAYGLTLDEVGQRIQAYNRTVAGGTITEMGVQYIIKGSSLVHDLEGLRNLIVGYKTTTGGDAGGEGGPQASAGERVPVLLGEVAEVSLRNKAPVNITRLDGRRCLGLAVYKETRYNTVKAVEEVRRRLRELERTMPGYHLTVVSDQGAYISAAIGEVKHSALLGIVLAVLIIFLFLRRVGVTLIVSVAIPVSILATFNLMYFNGLTINIMTLGGLALGAGMLVDNAIVVMENIFRNGEAGMEARAAAVTGTAQVGGAIVASTLTTVVVFLPIVYMHGAAGELFRDEAWTVAFSLLSSLFVAIFLIPVLYYYGFRRRAVPAVGYAERYAGYARFLGRLLRRRGAVTAAAAGLVGVAALLLPRLGMEFMPAAAGQDMVVRVTLPEGTPLAVTAATLDRLATLTGGIVGDSAVQIYTHAGVEETRGGDVKAVFRGSNSGTMQVHFTGARPPDPKAVAKALEKVTEGMAGLQLDFSSGASVLRTVLGVDEAPVVVEVRGSDLEILGRLAEEVAHRMRQVPQLLNVKTSLGEGAPELEVVVDRLRAGLYDIDVQTVINTLKERLSGRESGAMAMGGDLRTIVLRLPSLSKEALEDVMIRKGKATVRLGDVATVREERSPQAVLRRDQTRVVRVSADMAPGATLDKVTAQLQQALGSVTLPQDYRLRIAGEEARRRASMHELALALLLSVILVYMVLASQFESLLHPFTILLTVPLAGVGTVVLFFLLGRPLDIMAIIGVILLAGIAVNDSIILVDRILQLQREGMSRRQAIAEAGRQRLRPILMTSLTTIFALVPLIIGVGENVALRSSMALAVIGGMTTSTLLTLVVIPCAYDILEGVKERTGRKNAV